MWKNDSARGQICHVSYGRTRVEDQEDKVTDWPTGHHQRPHVSKRAVHWSARVQGSMCSSPLDSSLPRPSFPGCSQIHTGREEEWGW